MSLADILKNVYTFLEILQASRTNAVSTYDENSVRNAFQWATYCEQGMNRCTRVAKMLSSQM